MSIHKFLQRLATPMTGEALFDHLYDVVYFIKDAKGAYIVVNKTLTDRCGAKNKQAILGLKQANACLSDSDFGSAAATEPARLD